MKGFFQNPNDKDKGKSKALSKKLKDNAKTTVIPLLLLGAGESGKTTIYKQLRLAKGGGFEREYYMDMRSKLCSNVLEGMVNILEGGEDLKKYGLFGSEDFDKAANKILSCKASYLDFADFAHEDKVLVGAELHPSEYKNHIDKETYEAIKILWDMPKFREAAKDLQKIGKYSISDCFPVLMDKLVSSYPVWGGEGWIPDDSDILLARVRTTGFHDQIFSFKNVQFRLIDVGGQRSERRKWLYMFEGVVGVIFVAAASEYDQTLFEDSDTNRMVESITLFKDICAMDVFQDTAVMLFLNKVDLFQKKFLKDKIPLNISGEFQDAPKANETIKDAEDALAYIEGKYMEAIEPKRRSSVYVYPTTALDKGKMEAVFDAIAQHILKKNMEIAGIAFT